MQKILSKHTIFPWRESAGIYIRGHSNFELLKHDPFLTPTINFEKIKKKLNSIDGRFSLLEENEEYILLAADKIRSFPLFFCKTNEQYIISDNANQLSELVGWNTSPCSEQEFRLTGFVTSSYTLHKNIFQVQAGECVIINKRTNNCKQIRYFDYGSKSKFKTEKRSLYSKLDFTLQKVFSQLINSLNGRTAVIPLSGGYDSQLIVIMLHALNYKNVICFTYGNEKNKEAKISQAVAEKLNYQWHFIKYKEAEWTKITQAKEYLGYLLKAGNLSSLPHIQDWLAVSHLKSRSLIPDESIFVPGHTFDFLTGNHIPSYYLKENHISKYQLLEDIYQKHFSLDTLNSQRAYKKRFFQKIATDLNLHAFPGNITPEEATNLFEKWNWLERQSKFIVNSVRVYEHFGFEWRLPLWDSQLIEFWQQVPLELKINRNFYKEYARIYNKVLFRMEEKEIFKQDKISKILPLKRLKKFYLIKRLKNVFYTFRQYRPKAHVMYGAIEKSTFYYGILTKGYGNINSFFNLKYLELIKNNFKTPWKF